MNGSFVPWLLGGALVASLSWNALQWVDRATPADDARDAAAPCDTPSGTTADGAGLRGGGCKAALARAGLALDATRQAEVEQLLARCDEGCTSDDAQAAALSSALFAALRDAEPLDAAALRGRARELGELRAAAVARSIDSLVRLRELLGPGDFVKLLDACCGSDGCGGSCGPGDSALGNGGAE